MSERFISLTRYLIFAISTTAGLCRQSSGIESRKDCPNQSNGKPLFATVNRGDTCTTISESYHVSTADFANVNSLNSNYCTNLIEGKQVCIPLPCKAYKVQPSDTCQSIVEKQQVSSLGAFFGFNPSLTNPSCNSLNPGSNICLSGPIGRQYPYEFSSEASSPSYLSAASSSYFAFSTSSPTFSIATTPVSKVFTTTSTTPIPIISCHHAACHHSYSSPSSYYPFPTSTFSFSTPSASSSAFSTPQTSSYLPYSSLSLPSYSYSSPSYIYAYSFDSSISPTTTASYSNFVTATSTTLRRIASCPEAACHRFYSSSSSTTSKYTPASYPPPSYLPPSYQASSVGTVTSTSVLTVTSTSVVTVTSTSKVIVTSSSHGGCAHSKPHTNNVVTAKSTTWIRVTSCTHPCTQN